MSNVKLNKGNIPLFNRDLKTNPQEQNLLLEKKQCFNSNTELHKKQTEKIQRNILLSKIYRSQNLVHEKNLCIASQTSHLNGKVKKKPAEMTTQRYRNTIKITLPTYRA